MPDLEVITDASDPAVQRLSDLAKPSRGAVRTAIVEDVEPLLQSFAAGVEMLEVYADAAREVPAELAAACDKAGRRIRLVEPSLLTRIFRSEKRPKQFGVVRVPSPARFSGLVEGTGDVVVLDGVKIVGNIGAIIRTAFALGTAGVVLVDSDLATIADRRLVRASRGYVFSLPVVLASRDQAARWFTDGPFTLVDVDVDGEHTPAELADLPERVALLLGAEKTGASESLQGAATQTVRIPLNPAAESLNVSVAAGIVLYGRSTRSH